MTTTKIALDDEQVKRIEAEVDDYFATESHVSEIWKPPMVEALLDASEELVTGHRAPQPEFEQARARLALSTTNNLNIALKR
jgi:hypothetical protein